MKQFATSKSKISIEQSVSIQIFQSCIQKQLSQHLEETLNFYSWGNETFIQANPFDIQPKRDISMIKV